MNEALFNFLSWINSWVGSWGWSMVIFTILIRLVLTPLDVKSRVGMRKTTQLQPRLQELQKKYANDKEKLNQKMAELYRKEGVSPMSGCLPMILSMVVLWCMWGAMRTVANMELARQCVDVLTTGNFEYEGFLWMKNIWMPDSPFTPVLADQKSLMMIQAKDWAAVFASLTSEQVTALAGFGIDAANFNSDTVFAALQTLPLYAEQTQLWSFMPTVNLLIAQLKIYANNNGWFILPVLSAVTQYLMTLTQPQQAAANGQNSTGQFMKYFFPLFSLWICSSYNALFSLYWVISNVFAWIQSIVLNKVFENMEKKEKLNKEENLK